MRQYSHKKHSRSNGPLNNKQIDRVIEAVKESCDLCQVGVKHECCLQTIIKEWQNKKK